jgi:hypothetical protein
VLNLILELVITFLGPLCRVDFAKGAEARIAEICKKSSDLKRNLVTVQSYFGTTNAGAGVPDR